MFLITELISKRKEIEILTKLPNKSLAIELRTQIRSIKNELTKCLTETEIEKLCNTSEKGFCDYCGYEKKLYKRADGRKFCFFCKGQNPLHY